ncbi:MAG: CDGSH iron-sulfur domain-containing protein [Myxococcota bacterium]
MKTHVSLTVLDDGPIKISGDDKTVHYCGEVIDVDTSEDVYVCRCGESKNPPFCDGTHNKIGFIGEPPAKKDRKKVHVWEGNTIRTYFNPNACMHVFKCKPLKELRKRELEGDSEAAAEIASVVLSCPSGALTYESTEVAAPAAEHAATIDIIEGGELRVQAAFEINEKLQERQPNTRATLCRCGLSKNKPWCDGAHKKRENFR